MPAAHCTCRKGLPTPKREGARRLRGFTLVEIAVVLVIIGLLVGGLLRAGELTTGARVRSVISQQDGIRAAFYGFEERYRAYPGDYSQAIANILGATQNGNSNGRIEVGSTPNESLLAWEHLSRAGFLTSSYTYSGTESPATSPVNAYSIFQQIAYDGIYGPGTTASPNTLKHNIKTGSQIPAAVLAEIDRKTDDGQPYTGAFQFSVYQGNGATAPASSGSNSCIGAASVWEAASEVTNCGGASLL